MSRPEKVKQTAEMLAKVYQELGWEKTHWKSENLEQKFQEIIDELTQALVADLTRSEKDFSYAMSGGVIVVCFKDGEDYYLHIGADLNSLWPVESENYIKELLPQ